MRCRGLVHDLRERRPLHREELEELHDREQAVEGRVEAREDEAAEPIRDEERMVARRKAHLGLGGGAHPLDPATGRRHEPLDGPRREHRDRDEPGRRLGDQAHERREKVAVLDDPPSVIDEEHLFATLVQRDAEAGVQRGGDQRELTHLLLELVERARPDVLRNHRVDPDDLDIQRLHQLREELGGGAVRVVEHDLGPGRRDLMLVGHFAEERLAVLLAHPRDLDDPPDVVVRAPPEVLAEEDVLDLALLGPVHIERLTVEELHVADPDIERRDPDVHAAGGAHPAGLEPSDRKRCLGQVRDVDAAADDPAHERPLQHSAAAVLVAVHRDRRASRQRGRVRRAKPGRELRREVDVDQAGHAEPSEQ